jgi:hypothetical protein
MRAEIAGLMRKLHIAKQSQRLADERIATPAGRLQVEDRPNGNRPSDRDSGMCNHQNDQESQKN